MDAEGWLTSELASFACAACGQAYGETQIRLIAQRDELYFVDLSCHHCGSQAVAIVTIQLEGEVSAEFDERSPARPDDQTAEVMPAITVDDVIDAHALLRDFQGDLYQLVARFEKAAR